MWCVMNYWTFDGFLKIKYYIESQPEIDQVNTIFLEMELRMKWYPE